MTTTQKNYSRYTKRGSIARSAETFDAPTRILSGVVVKCDSIGFHCARKQHMGFLYLASISTLRRQYRRYGWTKFQFRALYDFFGKTESLGLPDVEERELVATFKKILATIRDEEEVRVN